MKPFADLYRAVTVELRYECPGFLTIDVASSILYALWRLTVDGSLDVTQSDLEMYPELFDLIMTDHLLRHFI